MAAGEDVEEFASFLRSEVCRLGSGAGELELELRSAFSRSCKVLDSRAHLGNEFGVAGGAECGAFEGLDGGDMGTSLACTAGSSRSTSRAQRHG